MATTETSITVSAPGKVLIVGGYLVLERPNPGLVVGASSRFYSTIRWNVSESTTSEDTETRSTAQKCLQSRDYEAVLSWFSHVSDNDSQQQNPTLTCRVTSPQFWSSSEFKIQTEEPYHVYPAEDAKANPFVQRALELSFLYLSQSVKWPLHRILRAAFHLGCELELKLLADNDFYSQLQVLESQSLPVTRDSLALLPKCQKCPLDNTGNPIVSKTGLGSSAALTTSVIGAVLTIFSENPRPVISGDSIDAIHRLSQIAHGLAQGKVGSGFDVCAACYGSVRYIRISEGNLRKAMDTVENGFKDSSKYVQAATPLHDKSSGLWDHKVNGFQLPRGVDILLADVCGGSETPSMVRKILQWRDSARTQTGEDPPLWNKLSRLNVEIDFLVNILYQCSNGHFSPDEYQNYVSSNKDFSKNAYIQAIHKLACYSRAEWAEKCSHDIAENGVADIFLALSDRFQQARTALKSMGAAARVPVEPDSQTQLIDDTLDVGGVIAAGVPGAGGYDAVFAIVLDPSALPNEGASDDTIVDVKKGVETRWMEWTEIRPCPLLLTATGSRLNCPHLETEGVRVEELPPT